jgi:hypothetical protein
MTIGPYLFGTVGGQDIHGVTAHGILLGEEFALPGKDTHIPSEKLYTFCQTHEKRPFFQHYGTRAVTLLKSARKVSTIITARLPMAQKFLNGLSTRGAECCR